MQIYIIKIKSRMVFKIKTGYELDLLSFETTKLLGISRKDVDQNKDGDDVPKSESAEVVLVHFNLVNSDYQQELFTFVPNKQFGQVITITLHSPTMLKITNAEFPSIEVWFTDQNNRLLETEDYVNITLTIGTVNINEMFI